MFKNKKVLPLKWAPILVLTLLGGLESFSNTLRDPFAPPTPPDSATTLPMMEAVHISTQGAFTSLTPRAGDSLDYVVTVEWDDTEVPVVVMAPDSLDFPGFKILGQATVHKKLASATGVKNHTEFIFRLRASIPGPGKAASMRVRYLTGISRQEEAVFIPTSLVDIGPGRTRLLETLWFKLLMGVFALGVAAGLALWIYRLANKTKVRKMAGPVDLRPEVLALKNRLRSAQNTPDASKAILFEMESLASRFLQDQLSRRNKPSDTQGNASVTSASPRFQALLAAYLAAPGGAPLSEKTSEKRGEKSLDAETEGSAQDWAKLTDAFKHARFAGGHKEPYELQEDFRTLKKCLKITGDDQP